MTLTWNAPRTGGEGGPTGKHTVVGTRMTRPVGARRAGTRPSGCEVAAAAPPALRGLWLAAGVLMLLMLVGPVASSDARSGEMPYEREWVRRFASPGGSGELGGSLAPASDGGVFVATSHALPPTQSFSIRRFGPDGSLLWRHRFEGPSDPAIVADESGGVIAAARIVRKDPGWPGGFSWSILVSRLDSRGRVVATRTLSRSRVEYVTDIAADNAGNVTLVGYSQPAGRTRPTEDARMLVLRLDGAMRVQWTRRLTVGIAGAIGNGIAAVEGGVVVAGTTYPPGFDTGSHDSLLGTRTLVARISNAGRLEWLRRWIGAAVRHPGLRAAAALDVIVSGGRIYATGHAGQYTDVHADDDTDGIVLQYSAAGGLQAVARVDSRLADSLRAGAATAGGAVFVGETYAGLDNPRMLVAGIEGGGVTWRAALGRPHARGHAVATAGARVFVLMRRVDERTGDSAGVVLYAFTRAP